MQELSEFFSGDRALTRVKKNENLQGWFKALGDEIKSLDYHNSIVAGRKIAQLISALEEVQEFHQIETSVQVKAFLDDTRDLLRKMVRTVNVTPKVMADLDIVSDITFAWDLINSYTPLLHQRIKENPRVVLLLRATFLKFSSILSLPLVRITQAETKDDVSVADYYSTELVSYVRKVLEIIPISVFVTLGEIVELLTHRLKPIPTKVERKYIKDFTQLDERYTLAKSTNQVSVYTQGILAMSTTLLGIIKLDPKQLLEDGIRKELVRQIATALHDHLDFKTGKLEEFEVRLQKLGQKLDGFRRSFEYIQDYINLYGLKIWQEEFSRIINYNVEQESNQFLKKKIYDWQSTHQSDAIPIPQFPRSQHPSGKNSANFMGRLARELLNQTDPIKTTYVELAQGWIDNSGREVVGIRTFSLLHKGVGIFGLTGMDRLISFMIVSDMNKFVRMYRASISKQVAGFVDKLTTELLPTTQFPADTAKLYPGAVAKMSKILPIFTEYVTRMGQAQLIRRQVANELNFSAKLESKTLTCSLEVMNSALLTDIRAHYSRPEDKPYPGNPILPEISTYLEAIGLNDPITKIYITTEPLEGLATVMFLFVLYHVPKLGWHEGLATLIPRGKKEGSQLDGAPFVVGVLTVLKQFHSDHTLAFLSYLGQFVRASMSSVAASGKMQVLPPEISGVLLFLEEFCKFSSTSRQAVEAFIPPYLFDRFLRAPAEK